MISSLQLVPQHEFTTKKVGENDFGVQDVMRDGFRVIKSEFNQHPLEQRLEKWSDTQQTLKYTMLRNTFGMGVPVMLQMEDYLLSQNRVKNCLARDVLKGIDGQLEFEDYLGDLCE